MRKQILYSLFITLILLTGTAIAQQPAAKKEKKLSVAPQAAPNPVTGSGTPGRVSKWTGVSGSSTYVLGDSNIFEDKFGKIGIGTPAPTSLLTVQGMIETTLGGVKFPDGTVQTTAALSSIFHDASLMGNGTASSPLGIANSGVQTAHLANNAVTSAKLANATAVRNLNGLTDNVQLAAGANITITPAGNTLTVAAPNALTTVAHDATLTGNGTPASPLSVVPSASLMEPVGASVNVSFPEGGADDTEVIYVVPSGKRLIIEQVSADCLLTAGQKVLGLAIHSQPSGSHLVLPVFTGSTSGVSATSFYSATHLMRLYAHSGSQVSVSARRDSPTGSGGCNFSLSGVLVTEP